MWLAAAGRRHAGGCRRDQNGLHRPVGAASTALQSGASHTKCADRRQHGAGCSWRWQHSSAVLALSLEPRCWCCAGECVIGEARCRLAGGAGWLGEERMPWRVFRPAPAPLEAGTGPRPPAPAAAAGPNCRERAAARVCVLLGASGGSRRRRRPPCMPPCTTRPHMPRAVPASLQRLLQHRRPGAGRCRLQRATPRLQRQGRPAGGRPGAGGGEHNRPGLRLAEL